MSSILYYQPTVQEHQCLFASPIDFIELLPPSFQSLIYLVITFGLDVGRAVAQEVVDLLLLLVVVPLALVVIGGLEFFDIGDVDDVSANGGEHDHRGRLELALEPDGNLGLRLVHSAATSGEKFVSEDWDSRLASEGDIINDTYLARVLRLRRSLSRRPERRRHHW